MNDIDQTILRLLPITISLAGTLVDRPAAEIEAIANRMTLAGTIALRRCTLTGRAVMVDRRGDRSGSGVQPAVDKERAPAVPQRRRDRAGNASQYHLPTRLRDGRPRKEEAHA